MGIRFFFSSVTGNANVSYFIFENFVVCDDGLISTSEKSCCEMCGGAFFQIRK